MNPQQEAAHYRVKELIDQGKQGDATQLLLDLLDEDANLAPALFQLASIMLEESHRGIAYNLMARACKLQPDIPEMWINYARAQTDDPKGWGVSEWCLKKALKIAEKRGKPLPLAYSNLATLSNEQCKWQDGIAYANKAIEIKPDFTNALIAKGFALLGLGRFREAWPYYNLMLGKKRENYAYGDEPEWDGTPGKRVIVSGEQGIGDEIMYASIFPDLIKDSASVVIECMPRLQGLFQRSFPQTKVYGTRWTKDVEWEEDHNPEAHVAMASLPRFYRNADQDFTGAPYLVPEPDMALAARGILDRLSDKPKIGIAWTGGITRTRGYLRTRTLDELTPILNQDATWISLEYNDRSQEIAEYREKTGVEIHVFDWITAKGLDYDLTAALVSQLDLVITVPTTVSQTAGGLGIETWVIVPKHTGWIFARDTYPWASAIVPMRNPPMRQIAEKLEKWLQSRQQAVA